MEKTVRVVLDLETCSTADLRKCGAQAYAEHPDTRVTVACYAIDDEPVETWLLGDPAPLKFLRAIEAGAIVVAHNYLFERNIYHWKLEPLGWPAVPQSQWSCTLARAYVAGLPGALQTLSAALKLSTPKDASAHGLMLRMARPRSIDPATGAVVWWHETSPMHYARLQAYCRIDVAAERLVDKAVPELSPRERAIFDADAFINQRGLLIDKPLVTALRKAADTSRNLMCAELRTLTNGFVTTPNQVSKLRDWLQTKNARMLDLRRETVGMALRTQQFDPAARRALEIRWDSSRSSVAKLDAILAANSPRDHRVRGCFQYYGAARTGRWAGRRLQPQNLFRGTLNHDFVPDIIAAVMNGAEPEDLELVYGEGAMSVIANCLRACIHAAHGKKLVIVDLGQIEARVVAWLAGETRALDTFCQGKDIYTETANAVGSSLRLLGKVLVLACGFGMGAERFRLTAQGYGLNLSFSESMDYVWRWRSANQRIVGFWYACGNALMYILKGYKKAITVGRVTFFRRGDMVLVKLPSGRHLVYREPRIALDKNRREVFSYMGGIFGGWMRLRTWPGKIVENITQAVARDVLADSLVTLSHQKIPLIGQVHDELIAEVDEAIAEDTLDLMTRTMKAPLSWAPGLPLDAKGLVSDRYVKA